MGLMLAMWSGSVMALPLASVTESVSPPCVVDVPRKQVALRIENLTDIVVGDPAILDFAGVVRKGDAVPVQGFGQFHVRLHILTPP